MWSLAGLAGAAAVLVFAVVTPLACSNQPAGVSCSAGSTVVCSCNGALTGQAACDSTGHEGACVCDGSGSSSGSASSSGAGSGSGSSSGSSSGAGPDSGSGGLADGGGEGGEGGGVEDGAVGQ
jgi:hypothetical protein